MNRMLALLVLALATRIAAAQTGPVGSGSPTGAPLSEMPVREVTVFKDGHAFLLHRGSLPLDASGNGVIDYLPAPVLGTFWPYAVDAGTRLQAVTSGLHAVSAEQTALTLRQLVEANVGREVVVTENRGGALVTYRAGIREVPRDAANQTGEVVLLSTPEGTKVLEWGRIADISFPGEHTGTLAREAHRGMLTLSFDTGRRSERTPAEVGLIYLQRGIRWIPQYRINIDGKGRAEVRLQATLVNDLVDLEDVTMNLVIGVPTFAFRDMLDPISLQETAALVAGRLGRDARTAAGFAKALMTQLPAAAEASFRDENESQASGPEVVGSAENEDLFVFTVDHVSLRKGERMLLPITEFELGYRDVFRLDIPFSPPMEFWRTLGNQDPATMAALLTGPQVVHKLRLENDSRAPLTTAPALILNNDRVLAQGLLSYTPIGSESDLDITQAVDIRVKKKDNERGRIPNAVVWQGDSYGRVDLEGTITLTNHKKTPVEVEIVRHVLGNVESADHDGRVEMVNLFEDPSFTSGPLPPWWSRFSWPWWWHHFNPVGRITWVVALPPDTPVSLGYTWNYYWR